MSAFACAPGWGSEPYVGHNWVRQMARFHDLIVLADGRSRRLTESFDYGPRVRFEFVDGLSWGARTGARYRDWRGAEWLTYYLFLVKSHSVARRLLRRDGFDLSHLVTYANFRAPFLLALLPRPSIFGPVGGGEEYPAGFERSGYEWARWASIRLARVDPLLRWTLRRTTRILAATPDTAAAIPRAFRPKVEVMRFGADAAPLGPRPARRDGAFRVLWAGLLIKRKALDLLLRALPDLRAEIGERFRVVVYGDGPERGRLTRLAQDLGVSGQIEWHGWRPRADVLAALRDADVFCFTSLRESGPLAILEAMGAELPIVCLAHSGPGAMVTDECGIRIVPRTPEQVSRDIGLALTRLARDPEQRRAMGQAARRRAEGFYSWDACGDDMARLYDRVVGGAPATRPS
jgi:glycosyltransferase involved in cell wall biosynthesis